MRGLLWPLNVTGLGDFAVGDLRELLPGYIRTVLQTHNFVDADIGGERRMRPSAYSRLRTILFDPFEDHIRQGSMEAKIRDALRVLVHSKLMTLNSVTVNFPQDGAIQVELLYTPTGETELTRLVLETATETVPSAVIRG